MSPQRGTGSTEEKAKPERGCEVKQPKTNKSVSLAECDSEPQSGISEEPQKKRGQQRKLKQVQEVSERSDVEFRIDATKKGDARKRQTSNQANKHNPTDAESDLENKGVSAKRAKKQKTLTFKMLKRRHSTTQASAASPNHSFSNLEDTAVCQKTKNSVQNFSSNPDLKNDRSRGSNKSGNWANDDKVEVSSLKHYSKKFTRHRRGRHSLKNSSTSSENTEKHPVKRCLKKTTKRMRCNSEISALMEWPIGGSSARPLLRKKEGGEGKRRKTGPIECKVCNRLIRCKAVMERHMLSHTGEKPFECDECGRRYTSNSNLRIHQQSHSGKMDFSCEECGQKFTHLPYLKRHLIKHSGNRQHMCDQCGKSFTQKYHLERHLLVHSGKMPYSCDQCDAKFKRREYLSLHIRNVHLSEGKGEKEVKAKDFKCDVCKKAFPTRTTLETHMRVHSGVTPYSCPICQRKFKQLSQMNAHLRTHSGEKPYACDLCGMSFLRKNYVRIHKEKKHLAITSGVK